VTSTRFELAVPASQLAVAVFVTTVPAEVEAESEVG
jgi:hypothetical protein